MKLFAFLCLVSFLALAYAKGIQVNEIDRTIDVSGFNVRHQTVFDIKNTGSESIKEFLVAFESTHVAYIKATSNDKNLPVGNGEQKKVDGISYTQFPVTVNLASGASASVTVYATLTHAVSPLPSKTSQSQPDRLALEDSHYVLSPYPVKRQETTVNGAFSWVKFTELEPTKEGDDHSVTFGPYTDIKPFQHSPLFLHFINRAPLLEIKDLVREIEVSHWGNVAVEETFELRNAGAELNQGFSRINYMHGQTGNSFNEFTQILPKDATDVYYRDVIGNISSSHVSTTEDGERVKFEITPRFVLFGGWRITYYTGYNLDASNYISVENGKYVLSVDLGVVFQEDFVVDNLEVRVILPEGATDIKLITPFHIQEKSRSLRQTYLDTTGRPVLTFTKSDFVADLNQKFQVSYNLSTTALLKEPLLLVAGYFAFFLVVIFLFRFELTITKTSSESHAQQLQAESLLRKALGVVESRKKDQEAFDQALDRYVSSKKEGNYKTSQQTFTLNEKAKHDQIDDLINQLRDISPRSSNLLKRIEAAQQKKLQALRDYHSQQIKGLKATSDSQKAEVARSEQALHSLESEIDSLVDELRNEL